MAKPDNARNVHPDETEEEAVARGMDELLKEREKQKRQEAENIAAKQIGDNPFASFVSRAEMQKELDTAKQEIADLRKILLKAKAQGKAVIENEAEQDADKKIRKLYDLDMF